MDIFSLDRWLLHDEEPDIMPAVTNLLNYLGQHPDHRFTAICVHPHSSRVKTFPNGSQIRILKSSVKSLYLRKLVAQQQLFKAGEMLALAESYDVVYGLSVYALTARRIGKSAGIPSVGRLFGSLIWNVLQRRQWVKLYTRHILQYLEIKYPCDLTISTEDGTEIDRAFNKLNPGYNNLHLLYNGVNQDLRRKLLALPIPTVDLDQPIHLLSMARLTAWKRHDLAIDLVRAIRDHRNLDFRLTIIGKGETETALKQQIKRLGLENVVTVKKPVPRSQLATVLSQHQVSILLYDASNLGNVMWESSLAGRLIVTRKTGKTGQVYNDENAVVWEGDDVSKLTQQVLQAINEDGIGSRCKQVRAVVDQLLPDWKERIEQEIQAITYCL